MFCLVVICRSILMWLYCDVFCKVNEGCNVLRYEMFCCVCCWWLGLFLVMWFLMFWLFWFWFVVLFWVCLVWLWWLFVMIEVCKVVVGSSLMLFWYFCEWLCWYSFERMIWFVCCLIFVWIFEVKLICVEDNFWVVWWEELLFLKCFENVYFWKCRYVDMLIFGWCVVCK